MYSQSQLNNRESNSQFNFGLFQRPAISHFKGMRFCNECDNMLYPKEEVFDQNQGIARLVYECSQCRNLEKAREGDEWDNCVYK